MKYVTDLECINCGKKYEPEPEQYLCDDCEEDGLLEVKFDYEKIADEWSLTDLEADPRQTMWRYEPLIPVKSEVRRPLLRVGHTPLYRMPALAKKLGTDSILIKSDGLNPTGSLKDRASAVAVAKALEADNKIISCASTGNAASSLAGNAASLGGEIKTVIFVPGRAPGGKLAQLLIYGAAVISVQGSYEEAYDLSAQALERWGWYNRNAAINPYLVEGKKTCVLEMAEQLDFHMPDWIVFSVGDGCTIAGAGKGMRDLYEIGFTDSVPQLLGVQAEGCAPITEAFHSGEELKTAEEDTMADSIAVGKPRNYKKALREVKSSGGEMINVRDEEILEMMRELGRTAGIFAEPAGAAGLAGIRRAVHEGIISSDDRIAFVVTGNGLKDIDNARRATPEPLEVEPDIESLESRLKERNMFPGEET